jgi:hypothetical protein
MSEAGDISVATPKWNPAEADGVHSESPGENSSEGGSDLPPDERALSGVNSFSRRGGCGLTPYEAAGGWSCGRGCGLERGDGSKLGWEVD